MANPDDVGQIIGHQVLEYANETVGLAEFLAEHGPAAIEIRGSNGGGQQDAAVAVLARYKVTLNIQDDPDNRAPSASMQLVVPHPMVETHDRDRSTNSWALDEFVDCKIYVGRDQVADCGDMYGTILGHDEEDASRVTFKMLLPVFNNTKFLNINGQQCRVWVAKVDLVFANEDSETSFRELLAWYNSQFPLLAASLIGQQPGAERARTAHVSEIKMSVLKGIPTNIAEGVRVENGRIEPGSLGLFHDVPSAFAATAAVFAATAAAHPGGNAGAAGVGFGAPPGGGFRAPPAGPGFGLFGN